MTPVLVMMEVLEIYSKIFLELKKITLQSQIMGFLNLKHNGERAPVS